MLWLSGIVDRPSDRLHVRTIPLSGCMDRLSVTGGLFSYFLTIYQEQQMRYSAV